METLASRGIQGEPGSFGGWRGQIGDAWEWAERLVWCGEDLLDTEGHRVGSQRDGSGKHKKDTEPGGGGAHP